MALSSDPPPPDSGHNHVRASLPSFTWIRYFNSSVAFNGPYLPSRIWTSYIPVPKAYRTDSLPLFYSHFGLWNQWLEKHGPLFISSSVSASVPRRNGSIEGGGGTPTVRRPLTMNSPQPYIADWWRCRTTKSDLKLNLIGLLESKHLRKSSTDTLCSFYFDFHMIFHGGPVLLRSFPDSKKEGPFRIVETIHFMEAGPQIDSCPINFAARHF